MPGFKPTRTQVPGQSQPKAYWDWFYHLARTLWLGWESKSKAHQDAAHSSLDPTYLFDGPSLQQSMIVIRVWFPELCDADATFTAIDLKARAEQHEHPLLGPFFKRVFAGIEKRYGYIMASHGTSSTSKL